MRLQGSSVRPGSRARRKLNLQQHTSPTGKQLVPDPGWGSSAHISDDVLCTSSDRQRQQASSNGRPFLLSPGRAPCTQQCSHAGAYLAELTGRLPRAQEWGLQPSSGPSGMALEAPKSFAPVSSIDRTNAASCGMHNVDTRLPPRQLQCADEAWHAPQPRGNSSPPKELTSCSMDALPLQHAASRRQQQQQEQQQQQQRQGQQPLHASPLRGHTASHQPEQQQQQPLGQQSLQSPLLRGPLCVRSTTTPQPSFTSDVLPAISPIVSLSPPASHPSSAATAAPVPARTLTQLPPSTIQAHPRSTLFAQLGKQAPTPTTAQRPEGPSFTPSQEPLFSQDQAWAFTADCPGAASSTESRTEDTSSTCSDATSEGSQLLKRQVQ
eukprot:1156521-Pelagomonas_calceolata.AAC.5